MGALCSAGSIVLPLAEHHAAQDAIRERQDLVEIDLERDVVESEDGAQALGEVLQAERERHGGPKCSSDELSFECAQMAVEGCRYGLRPPLSSRG